MTKKNAPDTEDPIPLSTLLTIAESKASAILAGRALVQEIREIEKRRGVRILEKAIASKHGSFHITTTIDTGMENLPAGVDENGHYILKKQSVLFGANILPAYGRDLFIVPVHAWTFEPIKPDTAGHQDKSGAEIKGILDTIEREVSHGKAPPLRTVVKRPQQG